jgi:hypothetical protein
MQRRTLFLVAMVFGLCVSASAQSFSGSVNPQIAFGGGYTTVYQLVHADRRSTVGAVGRVEFTDPGGTPLTVTTTEMGTGSSFNVTVPYVGTVTLTIASSSSTISVGTVRYVSLDGVSTGAIARYSIGATVVGVPSADPVTTGYVPLVTDAGFFMGIAVANGSTTAPVTVRFDEILASGATGQTGSEFTIAAKGQIARNVGPEVGLNGAIASGSVLRVSVVGAGTVSATPLLQGNNFISAATLYSSTNANSPNYIPQVVVGETYTTQIDAMNTAGTSLRARLSLFDQTGAPFTVNISTSGAGGNSGPVSASTSLIGPIAANGRVRWSLSSTALRVGWARIEWFDSGSGLELPYANPASAVIRNGLIHVGVSGTRPHYAVAIPVNVGSGLNTGFAVAFPGGRTSTTSPVLNSIPGTVNGPVIFPTSWAAGTQTARYVTEVVPSTPSPLTGGHLSIQAGTDGGGFLPFGLLDSSGVFSSTAVTRQQTVTLAAFNGTYTGSWTNTTFGSTGSATMAVTVSGGATASMTLTLGGNVFGGAPPPPENWSCTFVAYSCRSTFTSATFGITTVVLDADGALTFRSRLPNGGFFNLDGTMTASRITADYAVRFSGVNAVGTYLLNK